MKKLLLTALCTLNLFSASTPSFDKIEDNCGLEILTPALSERKTVKLRLQNGLEAYLVSDPEIEQSAAALAVEAGSWNDPSEYPGMAHFLEHMLFMGTAAYPREDEFMPYIKENGGKVNAYTASDRTVYMFSVNNSGFQGGLDRFSHFFIDPLFLPSSIDRELLAVDQEHAKNIENDGWRQYMIFKETGNPNHPNAKFSTGNADTLRGIPQDAMKKWYEQHYSAKKMHLVILSALPLDDLIQLTVEKFSAIPVHLTKEDPILDEMSSPAQRGHLTYIKPIKDLKVLSLNWELPQNLSDDNSVKTGTLLAYILKNGNKESLLGRLKREHLAESISVNEEHLGKKNKLFSIDIQLTEKGLEQFNTVILYCFETLCSIKKTGIPRYIFDEVQKVALLNYQHQSREDAFEFVQDFAHKMVDENIETFPKKSFLPTSYQPEFTSQYLNCLNPENCLFTITADPSKTKIAMTNKEKWMGAEYCMKSIGNKELVAWEKCSPSKNPIPVNNVFIPDSLELGCKTCSPQPVAPTLLEDGQRGKIYYSDDQKYLVPEVSYLFRLKSPLLDGSARSSVFTDIYIKALKDDLFAILSAAQAAGLNTGFSEGNLSINVAINGFSDKSHLLAEDVFAVLKNLKTSKEQFEIYKKSLFASYENGSKELPLFQSIELLNSIIFNNSPTNSEKLEVLKTLKYEDFVQFAQNVFKKTYIEGLLYGNLTKEKGEKLWATLSQKISAESYLPSEHHKRKVLILNEKQGPFMLFQPTSMQGNAVLLTIEEGTSNLSKRASQEVLGKVLQNSFFDTLRTKQQTAYIAKAWDKEDEKQLFQYFGVQSSTHKPSELIARFELFLENFIKQFTLELPKERFENVRQMAIASLLMPPENLQLMAARLFRLGFDYDGDFQYIDKRIDALKNLTYEKVRKDAEEFLSRKNSKRIAILVEGMTPKEKEFNYELVSKEEMHGMGTFVTKSELEEIGQEQVR